MLLELRVENYAVIDNVAVEFAPGLNLLTGETGAGKSILIDALALLLGDKASTDAVRHGTDKAIVSAVFEAESPAIGAVLRKNGIDAEEEELILRREISAGGKGRVFVNNQPATVTVLKQLAPHLAVIHAQNEAVLAFDAARGWLCWTALPAVTIRPFRKHSATGTRCGSASPIWSATSTTGCGCWICGPISGKKLATRVCSLRKTRSSKPRSACWPMPSAYTAPRWRPMTRSTRTTPRRRLRSERPRARSRSCRASTSSFATPFRSWSRRASPSRTSARRLRDYAEGIEASPERLAEVEDRLAALDRLKRKYGPKLEDVIALGDELERKLSEMENKDEVLRKLRAELATGGRAIFGRRAACRASATKPRASWRSWSRARSTSWR